MQRNLRQLAQTHDNHELHLLILVWELDLLYLRIALTLLVKACCVRGLVSASTALEVGRVEYGGCFPTATNSNFIISGEDYVDKA